MISLRVFRGKSVFGVALGALLLFMTASAFAGGLDFDATVSGTYDQTGGYDADHGISARFGLGLYFLGTKGARFGLLSQFEIPSAGSAELIAGIGGQFMNKLFVEVGGGYLRRSFGGFVENGWAGIVRPGIVFPLGSWRLRVSLGSVLKLVTSGITTRTLIEYTPYIGIGHEI